MPDSLREMKAEILKNLTVEERLKGISNQDRLKGMSPEEVLAALSSEIRSALLQHLKCNCSPPKPIKRDLLKEFAEETNAEMLKNMTVKERLEGLALEEVLATIPPADRLKSMSPEQVLAALPPEFREALTQYLKSNALPANSDSK